MDEICFMSALAFAPHWAPGSCPRAKSSKHIWTGSSRSTRHGPPLGRNCRRCTDFPSRTRICTTPRASARPTVPRCTPSTLKDAIRWNAEQGRRLSGPDLGRAEVLHTELFQRVHEFFTRYDFLVLAVSQVPPFDVDLEYPLEVDGAAMET